MRRMSTNSFAFGVFLLGALAVVSHMLIVGRLRPSTNQAHSPARTAHKAGLVTLLLAPLASVTPGVSFELPSHRPYSMSFEIQTSVLAKIASSRWDAGAWTLHVRQTVRWPSRSGHPQHSFVTIR